MNEFISRVLTSLLLHSQLSNGPIAIIIALNRNVTYNLINLDVKFIWSRLIEQVKQSAFTTTVVAKCSKMW